MKVNKKDNLIKENEISSQPPRLAFYAKIGTVAILLSIILGLLLMKAISTFQYDCQHVIPETTNVSDVSDDNILHLVSRDEWLAVMENGPLDKLVLPVHRVVISHTATEGCTTQTRCSIQVSKIQQFHMNLRDFSDIAYNFLIGGDGNVYVGRGWDKQGAHTKGYNVDSIGIAFIGTFDKVPPSESQLNAAKLLIEEGVRLNKLVKDYRLIGAIQLGRSGTTGIALYEKIKTWPNWSSRL